MHTDRIWRHLYCASGCRSREFQLNVMSKWTTSKRTVERSAWEREALSCTSLCLVPNTQCHFARKKTKNPNYNTSIFQIFENLEDSCGPRISLSWMCTFQPFYVQLAAGKQQADVRKDNVYGGIGLSKEEAKTFGQLLLHCTNYGKMNHGRPKIAFLWRHKFPPGCDGRVSKFPIQSLLLSMVLRTLESLFTTFVLFHVRRHKM